MMSDNKTEVNNKIKRFFGVEDENIENDVKVFDEEESNVNDTDNSEAPADEDDDVKVYEEASKEIAPGEELDVEHIVKEYYSENHAASIEDKIADLRNNADQGFKDDETEPVATYDEAEMAVADDSADNEKTKEISGMSELISLLKDGDEEEPKKVKKKKVKKEVVQGFTEENETVKPESDTSEEPVENVYDFDFEYTEKSQTNALFNSLRTNAAISTLASFITLIATVFCTWLELGVGGGTLFGKNDLRINALVAFQLLAVCIFFNLDGLFRGVKKLSLKRPAPEACAVGVTAVCVVHTIWSATVTDAAVFRTYCFAGCIMLFLLSLNSLIKAYTRYKAFTLVVSSKPKFSTAKLDSLSEENGVFAKYLKEFSEVLGVTKTLGVNEFIKRTHIVPFEGNTVVPLMYVSLIVSVIAAVVSVFVLDKTVYDAVNGATGAFLLAVPVSALGVTVLPYIVATVKVGKHRAAILGEAATDAYENASAVSFDDTEVFPSKATKVTSIKVYNEHPIDKVVVYMAKVFRKLGGPLSYVFESSVQDGVAGSEHETAVVETSADGIRLKIEEDDVLVGNASYLRLYDVEAPVDENDEYELRSLVSIVYLVVNNSLAAKFYIRYGINTKFENLLKEFHNSGICCGVKSFDPSITDELILGNLKGEGYRINVIRKNAKDIGWVEKSVDTGIVSLSGMHGFLSSFIIVDKLRNKYRTNSVFSILGGIIGLAVGLVMLITGTVPALYLILLYQLLWLVPTLAISLFGK